MAEKRTARFCEPGEGHLDQVGEMPEPRSYGPGEKRPLFGTGEDPMSFKISSS